MTSLSILITSRNEPDTIGQAIEACLRDLPADGEIIVVCPDPPTRAVVMEWAARDERVRHLYDMGRGKPAALNLGVKAAKGEIVAFTDGDVQIDRGALPALLLPLQKAQVGAVTGRPISVSPRDTMLGYWSHLLTDAAHAARQSRQMSGQFLLCSGYWFAARRALIPHIPEDALAEDAVISHRIAEQGWQIAYAPQARVWVKYPTTYADWLRQKVRSAGGYVQDYIMRSSVHMRSARTEAQEGAGFAWRYGRNWREKLWTVALFAARLHLWALVYWRVRVRKVPLARLWQRVASTK
ncbi:MAG: glycosyltransferase [Anaerolineae bacterium]|nr:glycosyltransferase [Anaerolineae bacterium]MDW8170881.1 glycosyltransferase [Anaerolineae bacterium]